MIEKNWNDRPVDPAWAETEIRRLDAAVDEFAIEMKKRLADKVHEDWRGWDDPSSAGCARNQQGPPPRAGMSVLAGALLEEYKQHDAKISVVDVGSSFSRYLILAIRI